jgi:quinol monooxygenase YgiN
MLTGLYYMTVKPERLEAFWSLITQLVQSTLAEDEGCITYVFHQQQDAPHEFVLYEQWRDQAAVQAHMDRLERDIGIATIRDFFVQTRLVLYTVVT